MSDLPNGRPPGQNNIDAGSPAYVPPENDPSAGAQKPDEVRAEEDGIEKREQKPLDPEVAKELDDASKNIVQPGSVEDNQKGGEDTVGGANTSGDNTRTASQPIDVDEPEPAPKQQQASRTPAAGPNKR